MLSSYVKLMRPYQWIKNVFCFSGVVFGFHLHSANLMLAAILSFITFCLASSAVYVFNDIIDVKIDKMHPKKKNRPIAKGVISIRNAWGFCVVLSVAAILCAIKVSPVELLIILGYLIMNIYYSLWGKHIVILDVFIISCGFVLRIFAGTSAIGIQSSEWLLLCVITLTLFLGFSKRRAEVLECERLNISFALKRKVLEHYEAKMLDIFVGVTASSAILAYAIFVVIGKSIPNILYTVIFVIYGIFRYIYLLYSTEKGGHDTANDLLDDKHLIITVILWLASYIILATH